MNNILINSTHHLAGKYKLTAVRPDGTERPLTGWFDNLITNAGMDQIAVGGTAAFSIAELFTKCKVGTGSTPPAFTDTVLVSPLAASVVNEAYTVSFVEGTPAYWSVIRTYRFGTGVAAGNLTEVAVIDNLTQEAFSRALITDSGGTPITVTVLSDEILDVTYELRSYIDKTTYTDSILISGVGYSMQRMPYDIANPPQINRAMRNDGASGFSIVTRETNVLGTVYQNVSGTGGSASSYTIASYTIGNFYRDVTILFATGVSNFATGIGAITMDFRQTKMKVGFTPKIPKVSTNNLSVTFRTTWARYP
jgi:hypothetical protein